MSGNIFTTVHSDPFQLTEEWVPLAADNKNAPLGVDMPSFAAHRRIRVAAFFFVIRKSCGALAGCGRRSPFRAEFNQAPVFRDPA